MNLKFLSGVATPAVCAAIAVALSQQAGAKEADIPRTDYPVSQSAVTGQNSFLTPEQQKKAQEIIKQRQQNAEQQKQVQDIINKRQQNPEWQRKADKITQDLLNDKSNDGLGKLLTGDAKTACEVILCLSSPHRPSECNPPIRKYLSIRARKWHKTVAKRKNFLKLCPNENNDSSINSAIERITNSEPVDCSAAALNKIYYHRANNDDNNNSIWATSGVKLVPSMVVKRCGANWQAMVEYKCDERQAMKWDDDRQKMIPQQELVNENGKLVLKPKMEKYNCRFVERKGYNGSYYF